MQYTINKLVDQPEGEIVELAVDLSTALDEKLCSTK